MERAKIIVKGRVQKAGYRDFIDEIAFGLALKGKVRNLEDGTIEVICEGNKEDIETLTQKIRIDQYPIRVEGIDVEYSKATGEFRDFEVVREEDITEATYERMDTAARYMREMNTNLGEKIDNVGTKVDGLKDETHSDFNRMDTKYDKVSEKMDSIDNTLKGLTKAILKLAEASAKSH